MTLLLHITFPEYVKLMCTNCFTGVCPSVLFQDEEVIITGMDGSYKCSIEGESESSKYTIYQNPVCEGK